MFDVVATFGFGEQIEDLSAELPEFFGGPLSTIAEQFFELAEGQFDRIEIGRIRRQVTHLGAHSLDGSGHAGAFVAGEIIHHDHVAWPQHFDEMLLDPSLEQGAVDRSFDAERRYEARRTHRAQEGRRLPASIGHTIHQTLSAGTTTIGSRHVGLGPRFVEEHDSIRIEVQLVGCPLPTRFDDVFPLLLGRRTRLFFRVRRSARQARLRVTSETSQPSSAWAAA